LIADVCASTGWTWDYVEDTLTAPRMIALYEYWNKHPPVHKLVAAYMGLKPPGAQSGFGEFLAEVQATI
jgi:hypothetical protein